MTTTLSNPNTATLRMDGAASLTIVMYGKATIDFTSANDDVWPSFTVTNAQSKTYGPYGINMSVVITALDGSLTYQVNGGVPGFGYDADSNITSLVDAAGNQFGLYRPYSFLERYGAHLYLPGENPYHGNTVLSTGDGGLTRSTELVGRVRDASNTLFPIAASNATTAQKLLLSHDGTRYGWQCDGAATRLSFASVPITDGSAPHFLCAAFKMPASFSATGSPAGFGAAGSERLLISFNAGQMKPACLWRDTAGTLQSLSPASNLTANEMVVISMYLQAGAVTIRVRGSVSALQTVTATSTQAAWTPTLGLIGGGVHAGATSFVWPGVIYGVIAGMGSPTPDVEIPAMEELLAASARFTLL